MSSRAERTERRRREWRGEVVEAGTPKGRQYDEMSPAERLAAMTELNVRAWSAVELPPLARCDWPAEVFEIRHCE